MTRRSAGQASSTAQAIRNLAGIERRILVYGGSDSWRTDDGVEVMSDARFKGELAKGL